jgi:cysteinyl-tRNA synthetase
MDDDLDTAGAVRVLFEAVRRGNTAADGGERETALALAGTVIRLAGVLGFELASGSVPLAGGSVPDRAEARRIAEQREEARTQRDFALADALRDEIVALGWNIEDTPDGPRIYR